MEKHQNKPKSLTEQEEQILWECGQLGQNTPRSLINTVWWLLTMHFGLRGRQEHHDMSVEDFTIQKDDKGIEFVPFAEGPMKPGKAVCELNIEASHRKYSQLIKLNALSRCSKPI